MKVKKTKLIKAIIFYALTIFLGGYIIFGFFASAKQTVNVFYFKGFRVGTSSMEPVLNVNDVVIARKVKQDNLKIGDIITFETYVYEFGKIEKVIVTHYIGDIQELEGKTIYKTQGYQFKDTDSYDEVWVNKDKEPVEIEFENIIGKYAFKIPAVGALIVFIQTIFKDPILLGLVVLNITIIVVIIKMIGKKKNKEQEQ